MKRKLTGGALATLMVMALTACGDSDDSTDGGSQPVASTPAATTEAPTTEPSDDSSTPEEEPSDDSSATGDAVVALADSPYGEILVDGAGLTLYMYEPDAQGASTCYEGCAVAWPPLVVEGTPTTGEGADDSKLGTVARTDGTVQVTYDSWPLYYWKDDAAPGDVLGQGVNDVWLVLDHDGEPIRTPPTT